MSFHRFRHRLEDFWQSARPWVLGLSGVGLLAGLWFFLANSGPGRAVESVQETTPMDDPDLLKRITEVDALEAEYKTYAGAEVVSEEALEVLGEAVEKQRGIARSSMHGTFDQQRRLEGLESELDAGHAKRTVGLITQRMADGESEMQAMRMAEAEVAYKEALQLQRAINTGSAPSRFKNYVREVEIEKALVTLQVSPLHFEKEAALDKARKAITEERWSDALAAYTVARDGQARINRDFAKTRFADTSALDRVEAEIASLNAASIAKEMEEKEAVGDAYARAGDHKFAADNYAEALTRQQQINQLYARSRFMSSSRIETLETKLQTSRSFPLSEELARLDARISADLRQRRLVAAEQALPQALVLTDRLAADFPRSRFVDGANRIKLSYLGLKSAELKSLQDEVFDRLLPLVGVGDRLLLASEVPQGLYQAVMNTNPSRNAGRAMPVDSVNWNDAQEFCVRLSWILGTKVRLPTVDEYRVALGAGGGEVRSSAGDAKVGTVDGGRANTNGYRDLLGNLAEWLDAPLEADRATLAGGSYLDTPEAILRFPTEPRAKVDRARHIGFRVLVELPAVR